MSVFSELDGIREQAAQHIQCILVEQDKHDALNCASVRNDIDQILVSVIMQTCNTVLVPK